MAQGAAMQQISDAGAASQSNHGWEPWYVQPGRCSLGDENTPLDSGMDITESGIVANNPARWKGMNPMVYNPSGSFANRGFPNNVTQPYQGWNANQWNAKGTWYNSMQLQSQVWSSAGIMLPKQGNFVANAGSSAASSIGSSVSSWGVKGGVIKKLKQSASVKNAKEKKKRRM